MNKPIVNWSQERRDLADILQAILARYNDVYEITTTHANETQKQQILAYLETQKTENQRILKIIKDENTDEGGESYKTAWLDAKKLIGKDNDFWNLDTIQNAFVDEDVKNALQPVKAEFAKWKGEVDELHKKVLLEEQKKKDIENEKNKDKDGDDKKKIEEKKQKQNQSRPMPTAKGAGTKAWVWGIVGFVGIAGFATSLAWLPTIATVGAALPLALTFISLAGLVGAIALGYAIKKSQSKLMSGIGVVLAMALVGGGIALAVLNPFGLAISLAIGITAAVAGFAGIISFAVGGQAVQKTPIPQNTKQKEITNEKGKGKEQNTEVGKLKEELAQLKKENAELKEANKKLLEEIQKPKEEIKQEVKNELEGIYKQQIDDLKKELDKANAENLAMKEKHQKEMEALKKEIDELKNKKLDTKDSSNQTNNQGYPNGFNGFGSGFPGWNGYGVNGSGMGVNGHGGFPGWNGYGVNGSGMGVNGHGGHGGNVHHDNVAYNMMKESIENNLILKHGIGGGYGKRMSGGYDEYEYDNHHRREPYKKPYNTHDDVEYLNKYDHIRGLVGMSCEDLVTKYYQSIGSNTGDRLTLLPYKDRDERPISTNNYYTQLGAFAAELNKLPCNIEELENFSKNSTLLKYAERNRYAEQVLMTKGTEVEEKIKANKGIS